MHYNLPVNMTSSKYALVLNGKLGFFLLAIIIFIHLFILLQLVFFPFPELFYYPYLTNNGLVPYKQIHDHHFPLLFFLPINLATLGMTNEVMARIWLFVLVTVTHLLIFFILKNITKDVRKSLLGNFLFLAWHPFWGGWVLWIDSFVPLLLLPTFFLSYKYITSPLKRWKTLTLIGVLMSLTVLLKPTNLIISFLLLGVILYFDRRKIILFHYLFGFIPLPLMTLLYFLKIHILNDFFYWTIIYNLKIYLTHSNKGPDYPGFLEMIVSYSSLLLFFLIKDRKLLIMLMLFVMGALVGVSDRWDSIHFQPSLPFLVMGMAIVLVEKMKNEYIRNYFFLYFTFLTLVVMNFLSTHALATVWYFDKETKSIAEKIKQHTKSGEEIFLFGQSHILYLLSDTLPAGRVLNSPVPWMMMVLEQDEIRNLSSSKPQLIIRDRSFTVDGSNITNYAKDLDNYIEQNYTVIDRLGSTEFMGLNK